MAVIDTPQTQNANRRFIKAAMNEPLLDREHEWELARKWRDDHDEAALHELTQSYMRLVISIASRFRNYGLPLGDLMQEGNVGLMQAAARFEPERELRFSTYATWWIRATIQDYVLRNWSIVRTGTTRAQKSLFFNLRRLRAVIRDGTNQSLSPEGRAFIAKELSVTVADVEQMENRMAVGDRSLNAPMSTEGESQWQDVLTDGRALPDEIVEAHVDSERHHRLIEKALSELTDRESTIIRERKLSEHVITLEALGNRLGISKERVRQIEGLALGKIKATLEDLVGNPVEAGLAHHQRAGAAATS
jgi:RNA polymerase sigma-32 factor